MFYRGYLLAIISIIWQIHQGHSPGYGSHSKDPAKNDKPEISLIYAMNDTKSRTLPCETSLGIECRAS